MAPVPENEQDGAAVHVFRDLVRAAEREDHRAFTAAQKALNRLGWNVYPRPLGKGELARQMDPDKPRGPSSLIRRGRDRGLNLAGA